MGNRPVIKKLIRSVQRLMPWRAPADPLPSNLSEPVRSESRAELWLGKDRLKRQQFYERWTCLETWTIFDQGLPLLMGLDPDDPSLASDDVFAERRRDLWEHLQRCVQREVPPKVNNPADTPANWTAEPVELYRWAVAARLDLPEELEALLAFVSKTVRPESLALADTADGETSRQGLAREQVLSAMLSLAVAARHEATGESADTLREDLLGRLYAGSEGFFGESEPPLSRPALHDLLDRSLEMSGIIYR